MFVLTGYLIDELIHENNKIRVYRGRQEQDGKPVIIKALKEQAAHPSGISRLLYEYEVSRKLAVEGIIKSIRLEQAGTVFALIMEDIGAISLREYIQNSPVSPESFWDIASQLAEILGDLHQEGVLHRDLKPENILIHPGTGKVKIIDFGTAVRFSAGESSLPPSDAPVGTLQYMPPEQTGRLGRAADFRSDFYSLGVVYYELLTGRIPWQAGNSAEWLHAQISLEPELQVEINPTLKPVLAIIWKLLSKMPEDRYQSAYGLLQDLQKCRSRLSGKGTIDPFVPGESDISMLFQLPGKLYGREMELEGLKEAFEEVCSGQSRIVLVSGYAGIGKTRLVLEALRPLAAGKGYFIAGKFDQLRQNMPYSAFAAAFGDLVKQLLTESREVLDRWSKRIKGALGRNGAVITELIPEVERLIGLQPAVDILPPQEAQNRFLMVFRTFARALVRQGHPLVLFLDDLQWADSASLQLLQYLSRDHDLSCFLCVGAYRDNEAGGMDKLARTPEDMGEGGIPIRRMQLSCLGYAQVLESLRDALHCSAEKCGPLAEVLYRKSGGNPFFLGQLLKFIHEERLLAFNNREGSWEWELEAIKNLQEENDVVGLILEKLQKLPAETQDILKIASCIGNRFDLETLSTAGGLERPQLRRLLLPALREGLVLTPPDSGRKDTDKAYPDLAAGQHEFLHDRVRQAVYSLIPEKEKKERHLKIGRLILQNTGREGLSEKILHIMAQLNRGLDLLEDPAERLRLAEYNLTAGSKAKAAIAYDSARQYFKAGMALLPEDSWKSCRRLSYDLYMERAQCEYMSGDAGTAEELFDAALEHAGTVFERADVCSLKMALHAGTGNYTEAVRIGLHALGQYGIKLDFNPGKIHFARELLLYKWLTRGLRTEALEGLPEIGDPVRKKVAELLIRLACVSSTSYTDLYGLICIMAGNYAVKYGNSEMASIGYIGYSIVEGSILGNYGAGCGLGLLSIRLAEKYNKSFSKCIVYFTVGAMISHWTHHGRTGIEYMGKAAEYGVEAGDVLIIGYALATILENRYILGAPLPEILKEAGQCRHDALRLKHEAMDRTGAVYQFLVTSLIGGNDGISAVDADNIDEAAFAESIKYDQVSLVCYYFSRLQRRYLLGDYRGALLEAAKMKAFVHAIMGFMLTAEGNFYHSLAIAAAYEGLSAGEKKKYRRILKKNQKQMKIWADSCGENFRHKYLLVAAEEERLSGRQQEAMSLYDRAALSARENGYVQNEALANELAAKFYMAAGHDKIARAYMTDACRGYAAWGAGAKVKALQNLYPGLTEGMPEEVVKPNPVDILKNVLHFSDFSSSEPTGPSDTDILQKAMRYILEETDLNRLFGGFLDLAVRIAGADRGYLILEKDGKLFIEAERTENRQPAAAQVPVAVEKSGGLARGVVRYVARTLETVVLNGGEQMAFFVGDAYAAQSKAKSLACVPVLLRGIPSGVLYLENSLLEGVFTPERLELLKLLSAQLISAKESQAYLEGKPEERTPAAVPPAEPLAEPLTARETEVLQLIAAGLSNREIADKLGLTANTVKGYIKNIYGKLGANRRVQVAARARELGLLLE